MSPEAVWMLTPPPISRALKSELALLTLTPPEIRSMSTSPDAVCDVQAAERAPRGEVGRLGADRQPRVVRAADAALDAAAAEQVEVEAALLRDVDDDRRPVAVRAQLDPGVVDEPLGLLVVCDQLDLDAPLGGRVDLDVAVREPHVELDRALNLECLLHLRLL